MLRCLASEILLLLKNKEESLLDPGSHVKSDILLLRRLRDCKTVSVESVFGTDVSCALLMVRVVKLLTSESKASSWMNDMVVLSSVSSVRL